ncbi:MFS transporter [Brachybacterium hainanense]|uniref:MFS transporter n=1 Tax=Brachybacterium hainanense TaxID=1541174 RepID=A0ABV6R7Z3_9MICO
MQPAPAMVETTARSRAAQTAAVLSLAAGIFILITIEELPIGVLTVMSADLGVSPGVAGLAVTLPGLLAAVVAVLAPVAIGRLDRRLSLVIGLASVVLSCLLSVFAPTFGWLLAARVLTGVAIGMYWSVLPVVAMRQVAPEHRTRALTLAMSGTGAALVLGVPLTSWLGNTFGWRDSFAVVGVLAALVMAALLVLVRPVRSDEAISLSAMAGALRHRGVRYAAAMTGIIVTGQFITYSYVSPLLQGRAGVPATGVGAMLLVFGIAGLVGNFAVAPLLRRHPVHAVLTVALGIAGSLGVLWAAVHGPLAAALVMPLWGLFAGAASVSIQSFVSRAASEVEEPGTAINSAMFNIAIATGAAIGGQILDGLGLGAVVATTVGLALVGALISLRYLLRHVPR